jgi:PAS domain S-box-containing protein
MEIVTDKNKESPDNRFYQLVLDSIEDYAVFTTDKNGEVNSWNSGASNLLGYTEREIIGQNSILFFTETDKKKFENKRELITALKNGRALDERFHVRKDGSRFWGSGKVFPIYDDDGNHIGFTKIMRNLHARHIAQEQLQEAQKYAESIVESAREPILVLNKDLTIYAANDAFYKLFRLNKKQSLNLPINEAGNGIFNIPKLAELLNVAGHSKKNINNYEFEHDWQPLGKKFFLINVRNLRHPSTGDQLILFSIEDITERRTLEQQKDDFISIASHEIRTPITVIKAYTQILKKRSLTLNDDFLEKTTIKINEKAEKLMSLVTYLLDVSQFNTGEMLIRKDYFNLSELIRESIDELTLIDPHKFITKGNIEQPVFADRFRISQVLNNLLNNASKYSPKDADIIIQVNKNKKGDRVSVSIKDSGMGIPKDEQPNLFKRFWRASSAKANHISGIGLGLHISSEIIKQHQGKMWLKSEKNKGSTFSFLSR